MISVEGGAARVLSDIMIGDQYMRSKQPQSVFPPLTGCDMSQNHCCLLYCCRVVESVMCEVGGRESVMVICGGGEVWLCAVDESGLTTTPTLQLSTRVRLYCIITIGEILTVIVTDCGQDNGRTMWADLATRRYM